jgi:hypothetical protein
VGDPSRAEAALTHALTDVFDGPLVRQLLGRRAKLRRELTGDKQGAAADLKKLHDLSPNDHAVMEELSALFIELDDYRGMVQLYEDQILRGKDMNARAELARKVARLWEEKLVDPREAADAWRRVLRMKAGDPEATAGLDRAKSNMLKKPDPNEGDAYAPPKWVPSQAPAPVSQRPSSHTSSSRELAEPTSTGETQLTDVLPRASDPPATARADTALSRRNEPKDETLVAADLLAEAEAEERARTGENMSADAEAPAPTVKYDDMDGDPKLAVTTEAPAALGKAGPRDSFVRTPGDDATLSTMGFGAPTTMRETPIPMSQQIDEDDMLHDRLPAAPAPPSRPMRPEEPTMHDHDDGSTGENPTHQASALDLLDATLAHPKARRPDSDHAATEGRTLHDSEHPDVTEIGSTPAMEVGDDDLIVEDDVEVVEEKKASRTRPPR